MKKMKYIVTLMFAFSTVLAGCGSNNTSTQSAKSTPAPQAENAPKSKRSAKNYFKCITQSIKVVLINESTNH